MMTEFYVQVKSNASVEEFPDNTSNKFKNRLPNVLVFRELGWTVGLSRITLPVSHRRTTRMELKNPFLFQFQWYEGWTEASKHGVDMSVTIYDHGHQSAFAHDESLSITPRSGTELMTEIRNRYLWSMGYQAEIGDFLEYEKSSETVLDTRYKMKDTNEYVEFKEDDDRFEYHSPPLKYIVMKPVENGECVLDNTKTFTRLQDNVFPSVKIGLELALKMKWIEWRPYVWRRDQKDYLLGPHLRKEFPQHRMPDPKDIPKENDEKVYYKTDGNFLYLSMFVNWVFTDLDRSFDETFGDHFQRVYHLPKRPLYVYSNAGQSVITGDKVTDLLREVPYNPEEIGYEPKHIQYIPLRSDVVDIIEVQVNENDGSLVNFEPGDTVVTLHYKR